MSATLSSYFNSGYWAFTVELSGDSGEVVFKEHSEGRSGTGFRFCIRGPCSRFQPGRPLLPGQETARNMDRCDRI